MSDKCVHEWYYRIVDIVSWQFFCIRCGEKLSLNNFADHASELEKNANALNARIAELEAAHVVWLAEAGNEVNRLNARIAELEALVVSLGDALTATYNSLPTHWRDHYHCPYSYTGLMLEIKKLKVKDWKEG